MTQCLYEIASATVTEIKIIFGLLSPRFIT